ncbi:MAG: hypothetical protein RL077_4245 [Verrucomicrobiota bacterium]
MTEILRAGVQRGGGLAEGGGEFADDGVDEAGLGGAGQRFCLFDGVVNDFGYATGVVIGRGLDKFETGDEQDGAGGEAGWVAD